jgi:hypothetical protein
LQRLDRDAVGRAHDLVLVTRHNDQVAVPEPSSQSRRRRGHEWIA